MLIITSFSPEEADWHSILLLRSLFEGFKIIRVKMSDKDAGEVDLREIEVYNPVDDGFDYATYLRVIAQVNTIGISPEITHILYEGFRARVLDSKVGKKTLREVLYGENGHFSENPVKGVLILGGKFNRYFNAGKGPDIDKVGKETNEVPFAFLGECRIDPE